MSAPKYLDVDSTYRNRELWPLASHFELILSQTGPKRGLAAEDPVSNASVHVSFTAHSFTANVVDSSTLNGTVDSAAGGVGASSTATSLVIATAAGALQQDQNYYRHAVVTGPTGETARVTAYLYLGNDRAKLTLTEPGLTGLTDGDALVVSDPTDLSDPSAGHIFIPSASGGENAFSPRVVVNDTLQQWRQVTYYDAVTGLLTPTGDVTGWLDTHQYSVRRDPPTTWTVAGVGSTASVVVLTTGTVHAGDFIRVPATGPVPVPPEEETRRVVSVSSSVPPISATVVPSFSAAVAPGTTVETLAFSYDNFHPLEYTGTREHEYNAYRIRLNRLILPNQVLKTDRGGQIAFYPYVYVELSPLDRMATNVIYSNNPHARKALFKASVDDVENLTDTTFVKLDGDDMTQVIKFKTETHFNFRVILPDGEPFETTVNENFSPDAPNPLVQISALFELKRV